MPEFLNNLSILFLSNSKFLVLKIELSFNLEFSLFKLNIVSKILDSILTEIVSKIYDFLYLHCK